MVRYCEQVLGGPFNRGNIVPVDGNNFEIDCFGHDVVDAFHSVFLYGEDMKAHAIENGVRGFRGPVYADGFMWDLDNSDIKQAQNDTIELVERLFGEGISEESIDIWFSGNKGFHVYLRSTALKNLGLNAKIPQIVKYVCLNIGDNIESVDESIYDRTRIIRLSNSKHPKTGLHKIGLSYDELYTLKMAQVREMATHQRQPELGRVRTYESSTYIDYSVKSALSNEELETSRKTTRVNMIEGIYTGFDNGNRNVGLSSLAGVLHARNMSPEFIHGIVTAVNNQGSEPLGDRDINTIIESVSKYEVDDDFKDADEDNIITMSEAAERWETLKKNRNYLKSGFAGLDDHLVNFDPGKVLMIAARGGVGKTLLGMQICNEIARSQGGYSLFISLEMPATAIYYRAAQIEYNRGGAYADSKEFTETLLDDHAIKSKTTHNWQHTLMVDKDSLSTDMIEQYYHKANDKHNGGVKIILIDYVGLIRNTDDYNGLSKVAREIKALAKRLNVRIVLLVQLSRKAGDGTVEPGLHMLRDSGSLEEAADMVLGMWLSPSDNTRVHNKFLKNRDGERGGAYDLIQDGLVYTCVPFDDSGDNIAANDKW